MKRIVVDIETVGISRDEMEEGVAREVERWSAASGDPDAVYSELGLNALTGRIVAIGMQNLQTGRGRVHFQHQESASATSGDGLAELIPGSEPDLLRAFWAIAAKCDQVITFNGRSFDIPFILYRSAAHRIAPTADLMPNRYSGVSHLDLMDRLKYFGAVRRGSLQYFCLLFGIEDPKGRGVSGADVQELWAEERYHELADYCWGDVRATAELYQVWREFVTYPPVADDT